MYGFYAYSSTPYAGLITSSVVESISSTQYTGYKLIGTGTTWSGSPFSVVSGAAVLLDQHVLNSTSAYLTINANGATSIPMTDGVNNFTLIVSGGSGGTGLSLVLNRNIKVLRLANGDAIGI